MNFDMKNYFHNPAPFRKPPNQSLLPFTSFNRDNRGNFIAVHLNDNSIKNWLLYVPHYVQIEIPVRNNSTWETDWCWVSLVSYLPTTLMYFISLEEAEKMSNSYVITQKHSPSMTDHHQGKVPLPGILNIFDPSFPSFQEGNGAPNEKKHCLVTEPANDILVTAGGNIIPNRRLGGHISPESATWTFCNGNKLEVTVFAREIGVRWSYLVEGNNFGRFELDIALLDVLLGISVSVNTAQNVCGMTEEPVSPICWYNKQKQAMVQQCDITGHQFIFGPKFKAIQELGQGFLKLNELLLAIGSVKSTSENIEQGVLLVEEFEKKRMLLEIHSKEDENSLVLFFVVTMRGADKLTDYLQRRNLGIVVIHGDLKQYGRERNVAVFRSGQYPILLANAITRGWNIPHFNHVINNDLPSDIDEYVYRTGRCGNLGKATSLFNDKNRGIAKDLMQLISEANKNVPDGLQRNASEGRPFDQKQLFPLDRFVEWKSGSKYLTLVAVANILYDVYETGGDWNFALSQQIPVRNVRGPEDKNSSIKERHEKIREFNRHLLAVVDELLPQVVTFNK